MSIPLVLGPDGVGRILDAEHLPELHVLGSVHHARSRVHDVGNAVLRRDAHGGLLLHLTLLGGDDDDTVGGAGTVDGRGGGIFQYGQVGDVGGVQGVEDLVADGCTIEDEERCGAGVDAVDAAQTDGGRGGRLARGAEHRETSHLSLKGIREVGGGDVLNLLRAYGSHGSRDTAGFLCGAIADDDDFLHHFGIFAKHYAQGLAVDGDYLLRLHAGETDDERLGAAGHVD